MTAIITDINDYRAGKADNVEFFSYYEDEEITRRLDLLQWHEDGWAAEGTDAFRLVFPKGRDPLANPRDSISAVRAEAQRRGII